MPSDYVVLFNTGLHDITFLGGSEYFGIDVTTETTDNSMFTTRETSASYL
jgi:hypothetical protein